MTRAVYTRFLILALCVVGCSSSPEAAPAGAPDAAGPDSTPEAEPPAPEPSAPHGPIPPPPPGAEPGRPPMYVAPPVAYDPQPGPSTPWAGVPWDATTVAPERLVEVQGVDWDMDAGFFVWMGETTMRLDPAYDLGSAISPPLALPAGTGRILEVWNHFTPSDPEGATTAQLIVRCDSGRVAVTTPGGWLGNAIALPDGDAATCEVEARFRTSGPVETAAKWWIGGLHIDAHPPPISHDQPLGAVGAGTRPALLALGGPHIVGQHDGALSLIGLRPGAPTIDPGPAPPEPLVGAPAAVALGEVAAIFATTSAGQVLVARASTAEGVLGGWEWTPVAIDGATALGVSAAGGAPILLVSGAPAGARLYELQGNDLSPSAPIPLDSRGDALAVAGSLQGVVAAVGSPDRVALFGLWRQGCTDRGPAGCAPRLLGSVARSGRSSNLLEMGGPAYLAVAEPGTGALTLVHADWRDPPDTLGLEPTGLHGSDPMLAYLGDTFVLLYRGSAGHLHWAFREPAGLTPAWIPGGRLFPERRAPIPGVMVAAQHDRDLLLLLTTGAGEVRVVDIGRALTAGALERFGLASSVPTLLAPPGIAEAWATHLPMYPALGPGLWSWPAKLLDPALALTGMDADLCLGDCCGGLSYCADGGGVHFGFAPTTFHLGGAFHEAGHHVFWDLSSTLLAEGVLPADALAEFHTLFGDHWCADGPTPAPTYEVDGEKHRAGFSPAGHYYDCVPGMESKDHHFINMVVGYVSLGGRLRRLVATDLQSPVAPVPTLLRDKYEWVRRWVFAGRELRDDGLPCTRASDCAEDSATIRRH